MNKKVMVVAISAIFALPALAQSNVTISGTAAVSYSNYKLSNSSRQVAAENRLDDAGSRFVIRGTEDLGGGLSAYFQIDNRVSLDTRPNQAFGNSQGLADGESFVGLKHKDFGQIGFGKYEMHYQETKGPSESYRVENVQMFAGTNLLSKIDATAIAGASRLQNTIKYDTPNWKGFSAKLLYSFNPACNEGTLAQGNNCTTTYTGNTVIPTVATAGITVPGRAAVNSNYNKGGAWNVAVRYKDGPINAYFSYYDQKNEGGSSTSDSIRYSWAGVATTVTGTRADRGGQKAYRLGGDYAFGFGLKLGLHYDNSKIIGATSVTDQKRTAWMLPVSYMFGAHGVYLTYAKANDKKVGSAKISDSDAVQWTLAYDYAFSKRTIVGASYVSLKNGSAATYGLHNAGVSTFGGSNPVVGEDIRQFSLNLTHRF